MELVQLIIGYIVGKILEIVMPKIRTAFLRYYTKKHREDVFAKLARRVIAYYTKKRDDHYLYKIIVNDKSLRIPLITGAGLDSLNIDLLKNNILHRVHFHRKYRVNYIVIGIEKLIGRRLFNAHICTPVKIKKRDEAFLVSYDSCSYFEYFTKYKEILRKTRRRIFFKPCYNNLNHALSLKVKPLVIGCHVCLTFNISGKYQVIIQRRSLETAIHPGMLSVVPAYGLTPCPGISSHELLYHNFLKEYAEELLDVNELIMEEESKRDPKWFYSNNYISYLNELRSYKKLSFELCGCGFDAVDGSFTLAILVIIDDEEISDILIQGMKCNWEIKKKESDTKCFSKIDLMSQTMGNYLINGRLSPEAAFSVSLARKRIAAL